MARRRHCQDGGYGWMGGQGRGMETATPEPEARGNRVRVRNTPRASSKVATILPAFSSFVF